MSEGAVAKGEAAVGITFKAAIITTPGLKFAGALPRPLEDREPFTAGVLKNAKSRTSPGRLSQPWPSVKSAAAAFRSTSQPSVTTPKSPTFETGTGLKAHDWFIIPLSKQAHDEHHTDAMAWEQRYGTHAELLLAFGSSIGFIPGAYMTVGMNPKRAAWLDRVLERLKRI